MQFVPSAYNECNITEAWQARSKIFRARILNINFTNGLIIFQNNSHYKFINSPRVKPLFPSAMKRTVSPDMRRKKYQYVLPSIELSAPV